MVDDPVIVAAETLCDGLTKYVPAPPDPVPSAVICVPADVVPPVKV